MSGKQQSYGSLTVLLTLGLFLWVLLMYTFLHEGGHALVAWLSGGSVHVFDINFFNLGAHVRTSASLNTTGEIFNSIAGMGLPLLVWLAFLLLAPRRASPLVETLKLISSAGVLGSLIPWVIIPLIYASGGGPVNDDAARFLAFSGLKPEWVAAFFAVLIFALYRLARARMGNVGALRELILGNLGEDALGWAQNRLTYLTLLVSAGLVLSMTAVINLLGGGAGRVVQPLPEGYQFIRRVELIGGDKQDEVIGVFTRWLGSGGILLDLSEVKSELLDVRLEGDNGFEDTLLHGEEFTSEQGRVEYTRDLPPGEYRIFLTTRAASGVLTLYLRGR
ncbi:MAG: M50 family metallopeptidase [Bellilinea sp.]|nr:M50 family metallopeptidase [Bellilinea sp.]